MQQQEPRPEANTEIDDWTALRAAAKNLEKAIPRALHAFRNDIAIVVEFVPKILDRYAELWEMTMAMMAAWEKLNTSKDSLYVPDAAEMVQSAKLQDRP